MRIEDRFWSKVDKRGEDECWNWTASFAGRNFNNGGGYGQFWAGNGKKVRAHRYSAKLRYGMFDERLQVMHTCDNTRCVNPNHLLLGTPLDNMRDMDSKGRRVSLPGEKHPKARLTDDQVAEIRRRYVRGHRSRPGNLDALAREFGVSRHYIRRLTIPSSDRRVTATQGRVA